MIKPKQYELTKAFKRDIAKLAKSHPEILVRDRYTKAFNDLLNGKEFPEIYKDHTFLGGMVGI